MNDEGLSPSEKGTAMHSFMQYCDYKRAKDNLEDEISRLQSKAYLTEEQAKSLNREELSAPSLLKECLIRISCTENLRFLPLLG